MQDFINTKKTSSFLDTYIAMLFLIYFLWGLTCLMPLILRFFQKGTYNAEEKLVKLQSELVASASKVNFKLAIRGQTHTKSLIYCRVASEWFIKINSHYIFS